MLFSFLKGTLLEKAVESPKGPFFLLDIHGIGFEVLTSDRSVEHAPLPGEQVQLFTTLIVREDALFLVGFLTKEERDLFDILQGASGVGVRVALSLLSALSVAEIVQAVVSEGHAILTRAKGVGPKLAQKTALELREKMTRWRQSNGAAAFTSADNAGFPQGEAFREAESVLLSLGYQPDEILQGFRQMNGAMAGASAETILHEALRWLAQAV